MDDEELTTRIKKYIDEHRSERPLKAEKIAKATQAPGLDAVGQVEHQRRVVRLLPELGLKDVVDWDALLPKTPKPKKGQG